jgi:hypothetical protein
MRHIVQAPPRDIVALSTTQKTRRKQPEVALAQTHCFFALLHVRMPIPPHLLRIGNLPNARSPTLFIDRLARSIAVRPVCGAGVSAVWLSPILVRHFAVKRRRRGQDRDFL